MELKELQERFRSDRFAAAMGAEILEARPGYAKCGLVLGELHRNAAGGVMGGVTFTLADFAFAVAANGFSDRVTVSQHVSITFLAVAKGRRLLAEARQLKAGRTTCLFQVEVRDELGTYVAHAAVNGFAVGP